MLNLKRWEPVEHEGIEMELKRLRFDEAMPLMAALADAWAGWPELKADENMPPQERARLITKFYNSLPMDRVADAFRKYVRNVSAPDILLDGKPITTGEELFEIADANRVFFVLTTLQSRAVLQSAEGKGSRSESMSEPGPETPAGPSDATAIESGAGPRRLTALETQPASASSLNQA